MHGLDRIEGHDEVPGVLDVYDELRTTLRGNLANRTELFAAVGHEGLKSHLDVLVHDPSHCAQQVKPNRHPWVVVHSPTGAKSKTACVTAPITCLDHVFYHFRTNLKKLRAP